MSSRRIFNRERGAKAKKASGSLKLSRFEGHVPNTSAPGSTWGQAAERRLRLEHGVPSSFVSGQAPRECIKPEQQHKPHSFTKEGTSRKEARSKTAVNFDGLGELQRQPRSGSGNPPGATGRGTNHTTRGAGQVFQLHRQSTAGLLPCGGLGPRPRAAHARHVSSGVPELSGGSLDGQCDAQVPGVWAAWEREASESLASFEGMAQTLPGQNAGGFPIDCMGGNCSAAQALAPRRHGCVRLIALSSYARPNELLDCKKESLVKPATHVTRHWSLVLVPESEGKPSKTGIFDISVILDSPYLAHWGPKALSKLKDGNSLWPLLRGVQEADGRSSPTVGSVTDPLPDQALRPVHRPEPQLPLAARSAAPRAIEEHQKCAPLREGRQACRCVESHSRPKVKVHSDVRAYAYGYYPGWHRSHPKHRRGRHLSSPFYVMDLFSGNGGVAHACRQLGFHAKEWDIKHGPLHDLTQMWSLASNERSARNGWAQS